MPDVVKLSFGLLGGLGLFLYGLQLMADGLQKTAGDRLRRLLEILTSTPLIGVVVGAVVTMLIQSSSATTVMVVGFVNAGLLTLKQAVSVIMGANIGTTVTAFMVSLKLTELALPAIGIGFILTLLGKRKTTRYVGQAILGFGLLFLGMKLMGDAMKPLKSSPFFLDMMLNFSHNPILGVLVGAGFTAVVQSSSATTGLVVAMAAEGLLSLPAGLALILGSNIGTTVTAMLASIGTQLAAKRAAVAHLLFNVFGVVIFLLVFRPFTSFVASTHPLLERQIANAHIAFNVVNTVLLLPFISLFVRLVERMTPGEDHTERIGALYLDEHILNTPSIALGQATRELVRMGQLAVGEMDDVYHAFRNNSNERLGSAAHKETAINHLEEAIITYLVKISQRSLSGEQSARLNALMNITNDFERIGDHAENIAELADYKTEHRLPFSDEALAEIDGMYNKVKGLVEQAISVLETCDIQQAEAILAGENDIDIMEKSLRRYHMHRLNTGICFPASGVIYLDFISNLERIADHANNIAESMADVREGWESGDN